MCTPCIVGGRGRVRAAQTVDLVTQGSNLPSRGRPRGSDGRRRWCCCCFRFERGVTSSSAPTAARGIGPADLLWRRSSPRSCVCLQTQKQTKKKTNALRYSHSTAATGCCGQTSVGERSLRKNAKQQQPAALPPRLRRECLASPQPTFSKRRRVLGSCRATCHRAFEPLPSAFSGRFLPVRPSPGRGMRQLASSTCRRE